MAVAYRLGADRWGFIAVETGMGKAEVDWLRLIGGSWGRILIHTYME